MKKWTTWSTKSLKIVEKAFEQAVLVAEQQLHAFNDARPWVGMHPQDPPEYWISKGEWCDELIQTRLSGVECELSVTFIMASNRRPGGRWEGLEVACKVSAWTKGDEPALGLGRGGNLVGVPEPCGRGPLSRRLFKAATRKALQSVEKHSNFEKKHCEAVAGAMEKLIRKGHKKVSLRL